MEDTSLTPPSGARMSWDAMIAEEASAEAPSEVASPVGSLAVAHGCLSVQSAELIEWLTRRIGHLENCERESCENVDYINAIRCQNKAQALREVLYHLRPRTDAAVPTYCQPTGNTQDDTRSSNNP